MHLGDIYYAGTPYEAQNWFLGVVRSFQQLERVPVFTLSGNHDMYAGGAGYYPLIRELGQPASYFCLRNSTWQVLAMDTGLHDRDPFTVLSNTTFLEPTEAAWHVDKIRNAGGRGTVLLSHHQLYSGRSPVGEAGGKMWGVNPRLYAQLREVLPKVTLWLWGHEHNTVIFEPASGGTVYDHGYAILTLGAGAARVDYYQVPLGGAASLLHTETLPAPRPSLPETEPAAS